jgi:tRNA(Ile)-lysidine synthase
MDLSQIVKQKLISLGAGLEDAYLVAVSGGADSTALLLAVKAALGSGGDLTVAHLDHGARRGSGLDLGKVVQLCSELNVRSVTDQLDPDELEDLRRSYGSLEAGMRTLRYKFLFEAARETGSKWILTGHTSDDQAETVLFRVARGMDWRSLEGIPGRRGMILRPLIDVPRSVTLSYCMDMGISPLTDPSNFDEAYARSRIRNRILPGFSTVFNPDILELLHRLGKAAGRLSSVEENLLNAVLPRSDIQSADTIIRDLVISLPGVLQRRVIVDHLVQKLGEFPSRNLVDDALDFILAGKNGQLSLPGEMILTLSYGQIQIRENIPDPGYELSPNCLELKIPGKLVILSAGIVITAKERTFSAQEGYPSGKTALLSKRGVTGPLWVRKRLPGDSFIPIGMEKNKRLKDLLVDRKVPRASRDLVPIVVDDTGDIVWVGGIEMSRKAALEGVEGEEAIQLRIDDLPSGDLPAENDRDQRPL